VPPTATGFGVPAASWWRDVRCPLCLARPIRVLRQRPRVQRPPVQRPASGACPASACPASGVRRPVSARPVSARPVSARPVSARSVSDARRPCPRSRAPCPTRVSAVRCERPASVRIASVSALSVLVSSCRARVRQAATRLGTGPVGVSPHHLQGSRCAEVRSLQVGRSVLPAAGHDLSPWVVGRPRWEALGRQRERARPHRGPRRQAVPQHQLGRERKHGLTSENRGRPAGTESGTILITIIKL
jgi:hypothetical protein